LRKTISIKESEGKTTAENSSKGYRKKNDEDKENKAIKEYHK